MLRLVFFDLISVRVAQFLPVCRPSLGEVPGRSGGVELGAGLLVVVPASSKGFVTRMRWMCRRLSFFQLFPSSCAASVASG